MRILRELARCAPALLVVASLGATAADDLRLVDAAKRNDAPAVRTLLAQGTDVDTRQGDGATALHWAAYWDVIATADVLLQAGASATAANDLGVTPLWLACVNGSTAMVERLLAAGADASVALPSGETMLMTATRTGSANIVRQLLARGADVNALESSQNQTALMWAAAQGHADVARVLIEAGADLHARAKVRHRRVNTETAGFGNEVVAEIDRGGFTPLLFAARQGSVETTQVLLAAGADPKELSPEGTSALVVAVHSGHAPLAMLLLERGADPNAADGGYTALHVAILHGFVDVATALIANGADPNGVLMQGTPVRRASVDYVISGHYIGATPVWLAARFARPEILKHLFANGADPSVVTDEGEPLLLSAVQGNLRPEVGRTPDQTVTERLVRECVTLAVDGGADMDSTDSSGNTALHRAAARRLNSVVEFLVERGATLDVKNEKGQTPLAMASADRFGQAPSGADNSTAELLRKLGAQ